MNTTLSNGISLEIKVGGKDLITSGIVHLEQAEFELSIGGLSLLFRFKNEESPGGRYAGSVVDGKLIFELINHNNSLGEGVFSPIEIGKLKNHKLYITYFVHTVEENKRSFEFALYLGD